MTKSVSPLSMLLFLIGGIVALLGTYWDDAWHTDRGRDSFTIPPHLLLYGGVLLVGIAIALWAVMVFRREKRIRPVLSYPPLALALIGDAVTLAAAPIDNAWHLAFGRDAVLWSPPHLLGVAGILAVGSSMLLAVSQSSGRRGYIVTVAVAALVLCVSLVPVMEYEADVPQFAAAWYLPVLTAGSIFSFALLHTVSPQQGWTATVTAILYTGFRTGIILFLLLLGFSFPFVPPIIVPALLFDLTVKARLPRVLRAAIYALAVYVSYVPYLNILLNGVYVTFTDVMIGLPLALLASWLVLELVEAPHLQVRRIPTALVLLGCSLLLFSGPVLAHDPGQGNEIGKMQLTATLQNSTTTFAAKVLDRRECDQLEPKTLQARRAGEVVTAPLHRVGVCQFQGAVLLPERGRWFVYAELVYSGRGVETWLPVIARETHAQFEKLASLYEVETQSGSPIEVFSSILLYTLTFALLGGILRVFRRQSSHMEPLTRAVLPQ